MNDDSQPELFSTKSNLPNIGQSNNEDLDNILRFKEESELETGLKLDVTKTSDQKIKIRMGIRPVDSPSKKGTITTPSGVQTRRKAKDVQEDLRTRINSTPPNELTNVITLPFYLQNPRLNTKKSLSQLHKSLENTRVDKLVLGSLDEIKADEVFVQNLKPTTLNRFNKESLTQDLNSVDLDQIPVHNFSQRKRSSEASSSVDPENEQPTHYSTLFEDNLSENQNELELQEGKRYPARKRNPLSLFPFSREKWIDQRFPVPASRDISVLKELTTLSPTTKPKTTKDNKYADFLPSSDDPDFEANDQDEEGSLGDPVSEVDESDLSQIIPVNEFYQSGDSDLENKNQLRSNVLRSSNQLKEIHITESINASETHRLIVKHRGSSTHRVNTMRTNKPKTYKATSKLISSIPNAQTSQITSQHNTGRNDNNSIAPGLNEANHSISPANQSESSFGSLPSISEVIHGSKRTRLNLIKSRSRPIVVSDSDSNVPSDLSLASLPKPLNSGSSQPARQGIQIMTKRVKEKKKLNFLLYYQNVYLNSQSTLTVPLFLRLAYRQYRHRSLNPNLPLYDYPYNKMIYFNCQSDHPTRYQFKLENYYTETVDSFHKNKTVSNEQGSIIKSKSHGTKNIYYNRYRELCQKVDFKKVKADLAIWFNRLSPEHQLNVKNRHSEPDNFFYHFNLPGLQCTSDWTEEDQISFKDRIIEYKTHNWKLIALSGSSKSSLDNSHLDSKIGWGLFSLKMPTKTGGQCKHFYQVHVEDDDENELTGMADENQLEEFRAKTRETLDALWGLPGVSSLDQSIPSDRPATITTENIHNLSEVHFANLDDSPRSSNAAVDFSGNVESNQVTNYNRRNLNMPARYTFNPLHINPSYETSYRGINTPALQSIKSSAINLVENYSKRFSNKIIKKQAHRNKRGLQILNNLVNKCHLNKELLTNLSTSIQSDNQNCELFPIKPKRLNFQLQHPVSKKRRAFISNNKEYSRSTDILHTTNLRTNQSTTQVGRLNPTYTNDYFPLEEDELSNYSSLVADSYPNISSSKSTEITAIGLSSLESTTTFYYDVTKFMSPEFGDNLYFTKRSYVGSGELLDLLAFIQGQINLNSLGVGCSVDSELSLLSLTFDGKFYDLDAEWRNNISLLIYEWFDWIYFQCLQIYKQVDEGQLSLDGSSLLDASRNMFQSLKRVLYKCSIEDTSESSVRKAIIKNLNHLDILLITIQSRVLQAWTNGVYHPHSGDSDVVRTIQLIHHLVLDFMCRYQVLNPAEFDIKNSYRRVIQLNVSYLLHHHCWQLVSSKPAMTPCHPPLNNPVTEGLILIKFSSEALQQILPAGEDKDPSKVFDFWDEVNQALLGEVTEFTDRAQLKRIHIAAEPSFLVLSTIFHCLSTNPHGLFPGPVNEVNVGNRIKLNWKVINELLEFIDNLAKDEAKYKPLIKEGKTFFANKRFPQPLIKPYLSELMKRILLFHHNWGIPLSLDILTNLFNLTKSDLFYPNFASSDYLPLFPSFITDADWDGFSVKKIISKPILSTPREVSLFELFLRLVHSYTVQVTSPSSVALPNIKLINQLISRLSTTKKLIFVQSIINPDHNESNRSLASSIGPESTDKAIIALIHQLSIRITIIRAGSDSLIPFSKQLNQMFVRLKPYLQNYQELSLQALSLMIQGYIISLKFVMGESNSEMRAQELITESEQVFGPINFMLALGTKISKATYSQDQAGATRELLAIYQYVVSTLIGVIDQANQTNYYLLNHLKFVVQALSKCPELMNLCTPYQNNLQLRELGLRLVAKVLNVYTWLASQPSNLVDSDDFDENDFDLLDELDLMNQPMAPSNQQFFVPMVHFTHPPSSMALNSNRTAPIQTIYPQFGNFNLNTNNISSQLGLVDDQLRNMFTQLMNQNNISDRVFTIINHQLDHLPTNNEDLEMELERLSSIINDVMAVYYNIKNSKVTLHHWIHTFLGQVNGEVDSKLGLRIGLVIRVLATSNLKVWDTSLYLAVIEVWFLSLTWEFEAHSKVTRVLLSKSEQFLFNHSDATIWYLADKFDKAKGWFDGDWVEGLVRLVESLLICEPVNNTTPNQQKVTLPEDKALSLITKITQGIKLYPHNPSSLKLSIKLITIIQKIHFLNSAHSKQLHQLLLPFTSTIYLDILNTEQSKFWLGYLLTKDYESDESIRAMVFKLIESKTLSGYENRVEMLTCVFPLCKFQVSSHDQPTTTDYQRTKLRRFILNQLIKPILHYQHLQAIPKHWVRGAFSMLGYWVSRVRGEIYGYDVGKGATVSRVISMIMAELGELIEGLYFNLDRIDKEILEYLINIGVDVVKIVARIRRLDYETYFDNFSFFNKVDEWVNKLSELLVLKLINSVCNFEGFEGWLIGDSFDPEHRILATPLLDELTTNIRLTNITTLSNFDSSNESHILPIALDGPIHLNNEPNQPITDTLVFMTTIKTLLDQMTKLRHSLELHSEASYPILEQILALPVSLQSDFLGGSGLIELIAEKLAQADGTNRSEGAKMPSWYGLRTNIKRSILDIDLDVGRCIEL